MRRIFATSCAVVAALALPATLAVVSSGGTAGASGSQITCTKLKGTEASATLSGCSGPSSIIGSKPGKGTASSTVNQSAQTTVTTWGKGGAGGTDTSSYSYTTGGSQCGKKDLQVNETTTVTSGTGAAAALVGDTGSSTVCVLVSKGTVANAKGTDVTT